jgi:HK97 family phage major capsid protein
MAAESTTTSHNDVIYASWIDEMILDEVRPYNVCRPFFRYAGPEKSNAYDFPIQDDPGAAAAYTEGTGLSNTAQTTSKATATAGTFGMMATVTQELKETAVIDSVAQVSGVIGRSVAEKWETDATALLDDFSNTTNTAAAPLTYAALLEAVNQLEQRDQVGTPVGVLDPAQVGAVRQDVGTSGAALFGAPGNAPSQEATLSGYVFAAGGAPWYQTSLVTATGGAVFLSGVALGLYEIRPPTTETFRDITLPGDQVVTTTRYGLTEIRDVAGETILL